MSTLIFLSSAGGGGTEITVVDDYTALLALPPTADTFYWCQNSQGTAWLPGSLGGMYYPKGMYYCFTTSPLVIEYVETPYQATQADVDAGIITDQFVSPLTLEQKPKAIPRTGTSIAFDTNAVYNSVASPGSGSITNDLTNARIGIVQKIYHQDTSLTVPGTWVKLGSGTYTPSSLNIIFAEWVTGTRVEYWIVKGS